MNPVEGGDIHLVPMNMISLEFAGDKPEEKAESIPPKPVVPGEDATDKTVLKLIESTVAERSKAREPARFQGGRNNENE